MKRATLRVSARGQLRTLTAWSQQPGVTASEQHIRKRLLLGWKPERAVFEPVVPAVKYPAALVDRMRARAREGATPAQLSREFEISPTHVWRVVKGLSRKV